MRQFFDLVSDALLEGEPFALGIITGVKGSSPQKVGAKALFYSDGTIKGTLGGGCLEAEIQDRARRALATGTPAEFELVLDHDFGWDDGLICGGKVFGLILPRAAEAADLWERLAKRRETITWGIRMDYSVGLSDGSGEAWLYRETVSPPSCLWIAGAGHIAQAIAPLAVKLDFAVTVFDDRAALANRQYFPEGVALRVDYWEKLLAEPMPPTPAFGLIVTRGHRHDALVLESWVRRPFQFLGMIGSRRKARIIFTHFIQDGIAREEDLARVACPVGIDIQALSVDEIAISIMAQFIQKRAEMVTRSLSENPASSLPA